jgi:hypothetical protein
MPSNFKQAANWFRAVWTDSADQSRMTWRRHVRGLIIGWALTAAAMSLVQLYPNPAQLSMYGMLLTEGLPWQQQLPRRDRDRRAAADGLAPDRPAALGPAPPHRSLQRSPHFQHQRVLARARQEGRRLAAHPGLVSRAPVGRQRMAGLSARHLDDAFGLVPGDTTMRSDAPNSARRCAASPGRRAADRAACRSSGA